MASQSIRGPNVTSGGNLPGRSTLPSPSSVSSGDRPSSSDVSGEQTKWTLDDRCLFMSHSSKNKDTVDTFVESLRSTGVNVWYDKDEIRLGQEWDQKIATDIPNMYGFICCMSKDFFDSDICYRELQVFRNAQRMNEKIPDDSVFPIVIDPSLKGVKQNWQMQLPPQTLYKKWPGDKQAILKTLKTFVKSVKNKRKRPSQYGSSSLRSTVSEESASGSTSQEHRYDTMVIPSQKKPSEQKEKAKKLTTRKASNKKPSSRGAPKKNGTDTQTTQRRYPNRPHRPPDRLGY